MEHYPDKKAFNCGPQFQCLRFLFLQNSAESFKSKCEKFCPPAKEFQVPCG